MKEVLKRLQQKTSEGEFVYELETEYELSPKMRESILETAKRCLSASGRRDRPYLFGEWMIIQGFMYYLCKH